MAAADICSKDLLSLVDCSLQLPSRALGFVFGPGFAVTEPEGVQGVGLIPSRPWFLNILLRVSQ